VNLGSIRKCMSVPGARARPLGRWLACMDAARHSGRLHKYLVVPGFQNL